MFRKGFLKKNQIFGNGPIRKKNGGIYASCLEVSTANYQLRGIFTTGSRPDIYFLGFKNKIKYYA
jgi:hypothetical protein